MQVRLHDDCGASAQTQSILQTQAERSLDRRIQQIQCVVTEPLPRSRGAVALWILADSAGLGENVLGLGLLTIC